MQKIKLLWDFKGVDSLKIAKHFNIHLEEFLEKEWLEKLSSKYEIKVTTDVLHSIVKKPNNWKNI